MKTILEIDLSVFNGLTPKDFKHLPERSWYNHNFFSYLDNVLYAESDDDNYTEWFLLIGNQKVSFAESFTSDGERLNVFRII